MSHVYVTSDWHIGHRGIAEKFRSQFPNDAYHDDYILENMRSAVTKRDVLIVIGDVYWTQEAMCKVIAADFPCKMVLVKGNHDTLPIKDYTQVFDEVHGALRYKHYWLTHIPIHPMELYRGQNIHGHCHRGGPYEAEGDTNYFNAILEYNNYMPVNIREVGKIMEERRNKIMVLDDG